MSLDEKWVERWKEWSLARATEDQRAVWQRKKSFTPA